jgi:SAM-dependent methyltransferase
VICRSCKSTSLSPFLDLGSAPPSNAYLSEPGLRAPELWFPLRLNVCESCWLVQTDDYAGREALFSEDYAYFSSCSGSWLRHAESYVDRVVERFRLDSASRVVEIAANDGYLLKYVKGRGIPCYGVEPTASTAAVARQQGIEIVQEFFGIALAKELADAGKQADLIVANNVLAHVPDINDFVSAFAVLLKPTGVATFEFPHVLNLVREKQFDTVYHEHYSYLSLLTVQGILARHNLTVFDVETLGTHGGSLRVYAQHEETGCHIPEPSVDRLLNIERESGINTNAFYEGFQSECEAIKNTFLRFLLDSHRAGLRLAGYGAAAKANTLLNFAGVRPDLMPYIVDKSPWKQGKFMPGSHIPIVGEDRLSSTRPDRIVVFPWNLAEEIASQLEYTRSWGAELVTIVPDFRLI